MSAQTDARALSSDEVGVLLTQHGFGGERPASGAVIIALADPLRIVWANQAATILFGSDDPEALYAQIFAGRGRGGLAESVMRLAPDAQPRVERLRLIKGFRSRTLAVTISRSAMPDGRSIVVLAVPAHDLTETANGAFAASALREPVAEPVVIGAGAAEPVPDEGHVSIGARDEASSQAGASGPAAFDDEAAAVMARLATMRSVRFIWQTDADHRIVKLTGGVQEMVGLAGDHAAIGRVLTDVVGTTDPDDHGLATALALPTAWSGVRGMWPLTGVMVAVPVVLGGAPIVQPSGFAGFRGFGMADLAHPVPLAPAAVAEIESEPVTEVGDPASPPASNASGAGAVIDGSTLETSADAPTSADPEAAPPQLVIDSPETTPSPEQPTVVAMPRPITFSSKVVALRPYYAMSVVGSPPPIMEPSTEWAAAPSSEMDEKNLEIPVFGSRAAESSAPDVPADLSLSERRNFDEIARALQRDPGTQNTAVVDDPVIDARLGPATPKANVSLDRLAGPALVFAESRVLYANRALLALTGHASIDALQQGASGVQLLDGLAAGHELDDGPARTLSVPTQSGEAVTVTGQSQGILWSGSPATLLTLQPAETDHRHTVASSDLDPHTGDQDVGEGRMILSSLSEAIATVDEDGRVLSLNPAAERLLGVGQAVVIGEALATLLRPQNKGQVVAALAAASAVDARPQAPFDVTTKGGSGGPHHLRITLRSLGLGKLSVTFGDRSEQAALRQELSEVGRELDDAKTMKSDFLAKVSHEVRTPLNAILGFTEIILDERFGPIGNHRYKDYLKDIHASGTDVLRLVTDLLDLSKIEAGRAEMDLTAIEANRVIQDCVNALQVNAHRERVILRLSLMPRLPAVLVDEHAFRQVVGNILSNAIKFNEPGGQVIVSTAALEAGSVVVRIRDTGIGMTDAEIALALEPFRQINTGRPGGGNGLGLPLTRALVEANGATMSIKSQKDEGTLVEIVFRACPAEQMRVPAE